MSFISKDHFNMALKGVKRLLNQKVDKSELDKVTKEVDRVSKNVVQSDWNETDENSNAYILNKPFEERGIEYVFVDLKNAPLSAQAAATLSSTCEYELIPGNIYKVIINGVEKEIECVLPPTRPEWKCLMLGPDSDWNKNVIFQWINDKSYINAFTTWNSGTSVKVIGRTQPMTKLSEKYIPTTIARLSDVDGTMGRIFYGTCSTSSSTPTKEVSVNGSSFILRQGATVCIYFTNTNTSSSATLNVNKTGAKTINLSNSTSLTSSYWAPNSYVTFLYDGVYWRIISMSPGSASTSYYGITKLSSSVSSTSTSTAATSSAVKSAYDLASKALPKIGGALTGALTLKGDPTSNLHAATKQYVDNVVKNVPKQAQTDWNQDEDTAIDFIKNKTHYDSKKFLVEQIYTLDDDGWYVESNPSFTLEVGVEYEVIFDDVVYQCIGYDCYGNAEYGAYVGNGSYFNRPGTNEEPFCIWCEEYYDGLVLKIRTEGPGSHKIIISKGKLKQLDEKFIPNTIARKTDISGAITTPTSASVGQTIVVKSVDDSGKPIEWETVDIPKQLIVNITANEENSAFISNKTHAEIQAAYNSGMAVICSVYDGTSNHMYHLTTINEGSACFSKVSVSEESTICTTIFVKSDNSVYVAEEKGHHMPYISNAKVGDIIKISEVDYNGTPTVFEPVDPWVLTDQNTSIKYRLSVIDGELTVEIVTEATE